MEIIEDAVTKAKEVFDVVTKKTGEAVTLGKQKYDVSSLKVKRSKDFEQLGQLYFRMIQDQEIEDSEIAGIVASIKEKNQKIKELNDQMNAAKNKRICPNCGTAIAENSVYCSFCGVELFYESKEPEKSE